MEKYFGYETHFGYEKYFVYEQCVKHIHMGTQVDTDTYTTLLVAFELQ